MKETKKQNDKMVPITFRIYEKEFEQATRLYNDVKSTNKDKIWLSFWKKSTFFRIVFQKGLEVLEKEHNEVE